MNGFLYRLKITTKKRADFCNMKKDREHTEPLLNWTESIMEMLAKIAVLGGFVFYLISIVLDIAGVDPFVTTQGQQPGIPHYIMWVAGAILGIYKTHKNLNK